MENLCDVTELQRVEHEKSLVDDRSIIPVQCLRRSSILILTKHTPFRFKVAEDLTHEIALLFEHRNCKCASLGSQFITCDELADQNSFLFVRYSA
jgi:hypothetical protein